MPEVYDVITWIHHTVLELHKAWLDGSHGRESTSFELDQVSVVRGGSFSKETDWLVLVTIVLDLSLSLHDLLNNEFSLFRSSTS